MTRHLVHPLGGWPRIQAAVGALLVAVAVAIPAPVAATGSSCDGLGGNLLANCGFESGGTAGWTVGGDTTNAVVTGRSARTGSYGFEAGPPWPYDAYPEGTTLGQTVSTTAGHAYAVSFSVNSAIAPQPAHDSQLTFFVYDGDSAILRYPFAVSSGWRDLTYTWIANSTSATVSFDFYGGAGGIWYVDDVVLEEVPDMTGTTAIKSHGKVTVDLDSLVSWTSAQCYFPGKGASWQACTDGQQFRTRATQMYVRGSTGSLWGTQRLVPITRG